ncbi:fimbria/pilus outer membrane usher protein [Pseudomonas sp. NPDC096917]|uniref:fimbria/pilus outer membrane usher protein n=1 Tax=Pseudomonas sp. NPDC096917 TaxID=3364483 RepID=UPI00383B6643
MTCTLERALPQGVRAVPLLTATIAIITMFELRPVRAQSLEFQSGFMRQDNTYGNDASAMILKSLARNNTLPPDRYSVSIYINQHYFAQREVTFALGGDSQQLTPCLSANDLQEMGVRMQTFTAENANEQCIDLPSLVPGATSEMEPSSMRLDISIPQIAMRRDVIGYVSSDLWQTGINAAFINYQLSAQQGTGRYMGTRTNQDINVTSGLNVGSWRFRSNQSLRTNEEGQREWARAFTYLQRDLPNTHASLTLGETFTAGDVFRSMPIKGLTINSDMGMLPDVLQGYAPIIRGVAQTRAKLEVLQNGYPIYSTYVSPGPYAIEDLSTAGGSGELEIVLTEEDGQVYRYTQPYASIGNLLRQGVWRYSATVARYNAAYDLEDPLLWQGTLALGTLWNSTLYGGLLGSEHYQAGTLGVARDFGAGGAFSFDVTHSNADIDSGDIHSVQGMSYAIKYGKSFASRTNLRFAGYRYSTQGYRDFEEALRQRNQDTTFYGSRRSRLEASVSQSLGKQSSMSLTVSHQDYWYSNYTQRQFQLQFNTQYKGVSYNVFASQALSDQRNNMDTNRIVGLSISMPLDFGHSTSATFDVQKFGERLSQRASVGGSTDENRLSYRASVSHDNVQQTASTLTLGYQAPFASVGAGLTMGRDYRNVSMNANGAVLLHADGMELGPYLGETIGLVEVPGISGAGVVNATGVRTNSRGFAIVPYLQPYRVNDLQLQTDNLGPEVEIENGATQLIPRRGAVVKATFAARKVKRMIITSHSANGTPLPFGARVSDSAGNELGMVGQAGQVMLSSDADTKNLEVSWGDETHQRCLLNIDPSTMKQTDGYYLQTLQCQ